MGEAELHATDVGIRAQVQQEAQSPKAAAAHQAAGAGAGLGLAVIESAAVLIVVFMLGVWSAETHLPAVRAKSPVLVIGPNGVPADAADRLILEDACKELKR